jgi:hypothetical protein
MNNLFNGFLNKDIDSFEIGEIQEKIYEHTNIYDNILHHPYIENLNLEFNKRENTKLIIYRMNKINKDTFIEYYLNTINCLDDKKIILENLSHIEGTKRIKGNIYIEGNKYTIVQIRDNNKINNWVILWDILINKHYYGEKIDENFINFFINHYKIDDLYIKEKICKKPTVLYTLIDNKYKKYINKNNSIQYCQNERNVLIYLSEFTEGDNVRNICFVEDIEIDNDLANKNYIIERKDEKYRWIFKNDNNIISFLK